MVVPDLFIGEAPDLVLKWCCGFERQCCWCIRAALQQQRCLGLGTHCFACRTSCYLNPTAMTGASALQRVLGGAVNDLSFAWIRHQRAKGELSESLLLRVLDMLIWCCCCAWLVQGPAPSPPPLPLQEPLGPRQQPVASTLVPQAAAPSRRRASTLGRRVAACLGRLLPQVGGMWRLLAVMVCWRVLGVFMMKDLDASEQGRPCSIVADLAPYQLCSLHGIGELQRNV